MSTQSSDTHPDAEHIQISLIRQASIAKRISRTRSLSQSVIRLSRRAIRRSNSGLFQGFCSQKSFKDGLKMRCQNVKLFLREPLDEEQTSIEFYLVSAEDIILNKLDWYRKGGCASDNQWHDVLGVLKVQEDLLDMEYLRHWASELKLTDLLQQAYRDAGINTTFGFT